jgi:hypothetical protein
VYHVIDGESATGTGGHHLVHIKSYLGIGATEEASVRYDFTDMQVVSPPGLYVVPYLTLDDDASNDPTPEPVDLSPSPIQGGLIGDSSVSYTVQIPSNSDSQLTNRHQRAFLVLVLDDARVKSSGTPMVSVSVTAGSVSKSAGPAGGISVKPAFEESVTTNNLVATVSTGYMAFTDSMGSAGDTDSNPDLKGSVGNIDIGGKTGYRNAVDGSIVAADDVANVGENASGVPLSGQSTAVFSGDFSFASKVTLDVSETCADVGPLADMRPLNVNGTVNNLATSLNAVAPAYADGKNLCIHLHGKPESGAQDMRMAIPRTAYTVTTTYAPISVGGVPATGGTHALGTITRDGVTVYIPYLTTDSRYNQRITMVNRGSTAVTYEFTFAAEADIMGTPGMSAKGMLAANASTVLKTSDVVTIQGGPPHRVSGSVSISSATPSNISVATNQTNRMDGSTDTLVYDNM